MKTSKRFAVLGGFLAVAGLGFGVAGAVAYAKVQDGYDSLQAFSEQQNVTLSYNEDGQLVDRGETEEAPRRSCRCCRTTGSTRWSRATSTRTIRW